MEEAFRLAKAVGDNSNLMRSVQQPAGDQVADAGPPTSATRRGGPARRDSSSRSAVGTLANERVDLTGSLGDACASSSGELEEAERLQRRSRSSSLAIVGDEPLHRACG